MAAPPMDTRRCRLERAGAPCVGRVPADAPIDLCHDHLLLACDWGASEVGLIDVLPSACRLCGGRVGVRFPQGWLCAACEWPAGASPDGDLPPPRVDVVYYLRFDDRVKIGTSANPRGRIAALPHDEVLAFELGDRLVERRRHTRFAAHRIPRTEWFEQHVELADWIDELRDGVDDPWQQYAGWVSRAYGRRGDA